MEPASKCDPEVVNVGNDIKLPSIKTTAAFRLGV
jgi:hypothetical protein